MADVVTIEDIRVFAHVEQLPCQLRGDGGLACARQTGEPDDEARVGVTSDPLLGGHFAVAPIDVVALVMWIVRAARIIVRRNNAAARNIETVHDYESARGHDL